MALSVNSHDTFKYVFEDQRALPADQQKYLIFRYLSARDYALMQRHFFDAVNADTEAEIVRYAVLGASIGLVGWHGYAEAFAFDDIDAVASNVDLMELARNLAEVMTVSQIEKKASVLRSLSTSAKSANVGPVTVTVDPTAPLN